MHHSNSRAASAASGVTPAIGTTQAITTGDGDAARRHRRPRWVIDAGNTPLGRAEISALVLAGSLLVLVLMALLRLTWPEATGGVKLGE